MNGEADYDDELERKNTDPRILPNLDKEKPFIPIIQPNPTIERSKTANRRRSVLGTTKHKPEFGPSHIGPNLNKTRNNEINTCYCTKPTQVSWADIVRRKPVHTQPTTESPPQDISGKSQIYAFRHQTGKADRRVRYSNH